MPSEFFEIDFTNGKYSINHDGNVRRNKTNIILKPFITNKGYKCVDLRIDNETKRFLVHRLVAMVFLDNPNNYPCVNHKDCNTLNNNVSNLEWCSYSYNNKYGYDYGNRVLTEKQLKARRSPRPKQRKSVEQYDLDGNFIRSYESITEASKVVGNGSICDISSISACAKGKHGRKTFKGFVWKFKKDSKV